MRKSQTTLACALVLALGPSALGGPINFKEVPADAKWVAHYDGEAGRSSAVVHALIEACVGKDGPGQAHDSSHVRPWACASPKDIDGVTLYGTRIGIRDGVAIVRGKINKDALVGKLKDKAGASSTNHAGMEVYTWTKGKGTPWEHQVALAFPRDGVLAFAASPKQLHAAVDLINGKGESLESRKSPLTANPPKGVVLLARAEGLKADDVGPRFRLFRPVSGLEYSARESDGRWEESLRLRTHGEPAAQAMQQILAGKLAMAELTFEGHPEVVKALEKGKVKRDGKEVSVTFEGGAANLAKLIPTMLDEWREQWTTREMAFRSWVGDKESLDGPTAKQRK